MSIVPMLHPLLYGGMFNSLISIFHLDGTVAITHGGIEMGQGINTKVRNKYKKYYLRNDFAINFNKHFQVVQVAAHILGISIEKISIKPSTNLTAPNGAATGGSTGSESACYVSIVAENSLIM